MTTINMTEVIVLEVTVRDGTFISAKKYTMGTADHLNTSSYASTSLRILK
jgi:hypothetical protein